MATARQQALKPHLTTQERHKHADLAADRRVDERLAGARHQRRLLQRSHQIAHVEHRLHLYLKDTLVHS